MIIIACTLFVMWHLRASYGNYKIMKKKDVENSKTLFKLWYIFGGPWTTNLIFSKKDKTLNIDDELIIFYEKNLKKHSSLGKIIQALKERNLEPVERERLRWHIIAEEMKKGDFFNIISTLITLIVAVFIGFGVAASQIGGDELKIQSAALSALVLIVIYVLFLVSLSVGKYRVSLIKTGLEVFEKLSCSNKELNDKAS